MIDAFFRFIATIFLVFYCIFIMIFVANGMKRANSIFCNGMDEFWSRYQGE